MPLTARQYFTLRRLHSLTGVIPVGVFLAEHFFTNSFALQGAQSYNDKVGFLQSIPYLYLVELFGIALPLVFHAALGVWIWWQSRNNTTKLPYARNFMFFWQRISGVFLLFYVAWHVGITRFGHYLGYDTTDLFRLMHDNMQIAWMAVFSVLGIVAASYHFGNGLWGFAIHWGLLTGRKAQVMWARVAMVIALVMAVVGLNSLLAFEPFGLHPVRVFNFQRHDGAAAGHAATTPAVPAATEASSR